MVTLTLRFLHINKLVMLLIIMIFTYFSICVTILSFANASVLLSDASHQPLRASIYYEKPSSARLAAPSHTPPACTYQNKKYAHGQQVTTPEPCLNCTCRKGVLLCFLRVCPTLFQLSPHENCKTVREPGQCCPTLKCETSTLTTIEASPTTPTIPTTLTFKESTETTTKHQSSSTKLLESVTFWNNGKTESTTGKSDLINISSYYSGISTEKLESIPTTALQLQTENVTLLYSQVLQNNDLIANDKTKLINNKIDNRITVTQKDQTTTIFQTSPSTTFHESLLLVTSSPTSPFEENDENLISNVEGSCIINGTIYAEGSAVISTSFCEYCYCIRSKRMCIRPRCHLSIMGCLPRYTSEYACCPTSYVCGEQALTTLPFTTTTTTTTTTEAFILFGRKSACSIDGIFYKVGDPIPSDEDCKQCYCSTGGIKKCKKIQCSSEVNGCIPVIPEGHCCPVEYKCNSTQRTLTETTKATISEILKQTTVEDIDENVTHSIDSITSSDETTTISMKDLNEINTESYETDSTANDEIFNSNITSKLKSSDSNDEILSPETTTSLGFENPTEINLNITTNDTKSHHSRNEEIVYENESENLLSNTELMNSNKIFSESKNESLETTTNAVLDDKIETKTEAFSDIGITNPNTEINIENTQTYETTTESVSTSPNSLSSLSSDTSNSTQSVPHETTLGAMTSTLNDSYPMLSRNEDDSSNRSTNATTYQKVEEFLQEIIHALDDRLHGRIPAEPRIKDKNSNEVLLSKKINDQEMLKPVSSRSEVNAGVSSSILISDDHESHRYKSHSDSDGVEIITAKTAFYDLHENVGDSILINLTPSSLRVGSSPLSDSYNDKNTQTLAQNNRSPIYGKPAHSYSLYRPTNDWKIVGSNFPRRPQFENSFSDSGSIDSLYYNDNIRRHDTEETFEDINKELDKKPRLDVNNPNDATRMKVFPFKINEAVGSLSLKKKNGSFIIRLPAPNKNISPDSAPKTQQQISCFYNSQEYPNGAMIPNPDPCNLCRCFYGRELCQEQKCPSPPEKDCVPEKLSGYCCPRYICRITEDQKSNLNSNKTFPQTKPLFMPSKPETSSVSSVRKGPQFPSTVETNINISSPFEGNNNGHSLTDILPQNLNHFDDKSSKEEVDKYYQSIPEFPAVPSHVHGLQSRYPPFPLDPTPKPHHRIPSHNSNSKIQITNRIHFPMNSMNEKEQQNGSQPPLSDSISALIPPHPQPSSPFIAGPFQGQHNGGTNKYRLKPSQTVSQQQPPNANPQRPNLRLPPFLLHNMPNAHLAINNNNMRIKPNVISQNSHSIPSPEPSKPVTSEISHEFSPAIVSLKTSNSTLNELSNKTKIESSTRSTIVNPQSIKNINSMFDSMQTTPKPTPKTTKAQLITSVTTNSLASSTSPSTTTSTTTTTTTTTLITTSSVPKTTEKIESKPMNTWDIFKVSGCNIYGTMYKIDEQISQLSNSCKKCICSSQGVKCNNIC